MSTERTAGPGRAPRTSSRRGPVALALLRRVPGYLGLGFLWLWVAFSVFAFGWVVMASLKTNQEFFGNMWALPSVPQWGNYARAFVSGNLGQYFLNTLVVVGASTIVLLVISAPAAYTLSRIKFPGNKQIISLFLIGIGIPVQIIMIPLFFLMFNLGLVNTLFGLGLVYVATHLAFTVFLLIGFYDSLPGALEDAAVIDGCSRFQTYRHVMLPLSYPGITTAAIFNVIFIINEFLLALVLLVDNDKFTLSIGLHALYGNMKYTGDWVGLFAGFTMVMAPALILFLFVSRRIIEGLTMGAVD